MSLYLNEFLVYLANFLAILIVLPCHEFAHAFAAYKNGDPTAKMMGRYTLNPIKHFDPLGLAMLVLLRFGWAKPVPVNPNNFIHYKKGCIWVSIAGVLTNIVLAFILCPLALLSFKIPIYSEYLLYPTLLLIYFLQSLFYLNIGLFVFNLLPLYPLDGFRLYDALTTRRGKFYWNLKRYSQYILMGILLLGWIGPKIGIPWLNIISVAVDLVSMPIIKFWELIIF